MRDPKLITMFIIRCVWHVVALIIWIIALNIFANQNGNDTSSTYFGAMALCLIPIAWPIIRFIGRAFGAGYAAGRNSWDIDFTNGRVYNRGPKVAIIVAIIAILLCIGFGLFILPIYWVWFAVGTVRLGIEAFRKQ